MRTVSQVVAVLGTGGISTDERLQRVVDLNLTNIKRKLQEPYPEGKGWTIAQCDEAEKWYKRFLSVIIKFPDARAVPNGPIDAFWHQHILDTAAYREDCAHVLGYFLDHYPYFGLNGDAAERDESFDDTNDLYRQMFGEDCTKMTFGTKGATCVPEACHGGGTCSPCTVDRRNKAVCPPVARGSQCNSGGSGTGCSQGCRRGTRVPTRVNSFDQIVSLTLQHDVGD